MASFAPKRSLGGGGGVPPPAPRDTPRDAKLEARWKVNVFALSFIVGCIVNSAQAVRHYAFLCPHRAAFSICAFCASGYEITFLCPILFYHVSSDISKSLNMSSQRVRLDLQFLAIPTIWTRRQEQIYGHYALVPELQRGRAKVAEDGWSLRNEFLKMAHSEEAALRFLGKVGVWGLGQRAPWSGAKSLSGAYGHRYVSAPLYPLPMTIEELWAEQETWKELLRKPAALRTKFAQPPNSDARPIDHINFALNTHFQNTLPMHLEWKRHPIGIIQPITGRELLIATVWIDLVRGSPFQECDYCGTPFTWDRKRTYCPPRDETGVSACAHAAAQRMYKKREDAKNRRADRTRLRKPKTLR